MKLKIEFECKCGTSSSNVIDTDKIGKKICVLYGADKPVFNIIKENLLYCFIDLGRIAPGQNQRNSVSYTPKMFFWSSDAPLIPIKQSHIFKKFLQLCDKQTYQKIVNNLEDFRESTLLKKLIYPDYDPGIYQKTGKPSGGDAIIDLFFKERKIFDFMDRKNEYLYNRYNKIKNINDIHSGKMISVTRSRFYNVGNIQLNNERNIL